jgi:hypothetical protein
MYVFITLPCSSHFLLGFLTRNLSAIVAFTYAIRIAGAVVGAL